MKRLLLLLALLFVGPAQAQIGPPQQIQCNNIATLTAGGTGLTQVVAAVTGKLIFICGWHITNTGASGTWLLASGTGSNCGTTTVTVIPAQSVTSSAPASDHIDFSQLQIGPSLALCINPSVNTIAGLVWFGQY